MTHNVICHANTLPEFRAHLTARAGHALRSAVSFGVDQSRATFFDHLGRGQRMVLVDQDIETAWTDFALAFAENPRAPLAIHVGPKLTVPAHATAVYLYLWPAQNSGEAWRRALAAGGTLVNLEDFLASGISLLEFSQRALGDLLLRARPTFLSLDLAAFTAPFGIRPAEFWSVLTTLLHRLDVRAFGLNSAPPDLAVEFVKIFLHANQDVSSV